MSREAIRVAWLGGRANRFRNGLRGGHLPVRPKRTATERQRRIQRAQWTAHGRLHTSFSRDGIGPEVALTVQQIYLPVRGSLASSTGQPDGAPALRSMSVSVHDSIAITENLRMDYGSSLDSVSYLDHVNSLNEFGRLTYDLGAGGKVKVAYSSGAPPVELAMTPRDAEGDAEALAQDLVALAVLPRLSLLDGHSAIQRSQDAEIGYEKQIRDTRFNLSRITRGSPTMQ